MSARCPKLLTFIVLLCLVAGCSPAPEPTDTPTPEPVISPTPTPEPEPTATETDATWIRSYGGTRDTLAGGILPAGDGGFYIVGTANLVWEPVTRGDIYLFRTDAAGQVLWERTFGDGTFDTGLAVIRADDGNLLIVGGTDASGSEDAYVAKVDPDGELLWERTYGGPLDEYAAGIAPTSDGGYLLSGNIVDPDDIITESGVAGYAGFDGRSNLYLLKIDSEGNELWSRTLVSAENVIGGGAIPTPDNGFLLLASVLYFPVPDNDLLLVKLDEDGDEVWTRTWDEEDLVAYDMFTTPDGNFLILASYQPLGSSAEEQDMLLISVDPEGNEISRAMYGEAGMVDTGSAAGGTADGGAVVVGERARDLNTWDTEFFLLRTDMQGQQVWERTELTDHSMYASVEEQPDGSFIILASRYNGQVFDILLIKVDAEGNL